MIGLTWFPKYSDPTSAFIKKHCYFIGFDRQYVEVYCITDEIYLNKISLIYLMCYLVSSSLAEELLLAAYTLTLQT